MTAPENDPVRKLAALLETAPSDDRQQITAWLLHTGRMPVWPDPPTDVASSLGAGLSPIGAHARLRHLGSALTTGEGSQLVTIRLPADRHARLRQWCAQHGFTMATVVRGLVERFLTQEGAAPSTGTPDAASGPPAPATLPTGTPDLSSGTPAPATPPTGNPSSGTPAPEAPAPAP